MLTKHCLGVAGGRTQWRPFEFWENKKGLRKKGKSSPGETAVSWRIIGGDLQDIACNSRLSGWQALVTSNQWLRWRRPHKISFRRETILFLLSKSNLKLWLSFEQNDFYVAGMILKRLAMRKALRIGRAVNETASGWSDFWRAPLKSNVLTLRVGFLTWIFYRFFVNR